jgi:hypothetical protein
MRKFLNLNLWHALGLWSRQTINSSQAKGFQISNLINFLRFDVKLVVSYGLHMIIMDNLHWRHLLAKPSATATRASHLGRRDNKGVIALNYANVNTA